MSVPVLPHRRDLRQGDLVFPEEILRIGHTLDFQLDCVSKEVQQEVFGSELDTSSLCDWLNLHTAYDFALQDVADHIEITLCRNFGKKAHPFLYPLNRAERDVLRGEMEACCQRRTDRSLAQQYSHLLTTEEAEPPELTVGTHRLPMGEVGFAEDLSECGGLLQFYMPVTFDPDAVYTIATNDFLAAGGDSYYAFQTASVRYDLGLSVDEVVADYITEYLGGTVTYESYALPDGRITLEQDVPFTDVNGADPYYDAVKYCYEHDIFKGITETTFVPNGTMNRGQMITVLWRMSGSPEPALRPMPMWPWILPLPKPLPGGMSSSWSTAILPPSISRGRPSPSSSF